MNAGLIAGGSASTGVGLGAGGSVTNQSGGIISGKYGITGGLTAVTVVNAGTIFGSGGEGIYLVAGGTISNRHPA